MCNRRLLNEVLSSLGKEYTILKEGDRSYRIYLDKKNPIAGMGGTCIVYNAWKECVNSEGKAIKKRIILKEFYPELTEDIRDERISEDVPSVLGENDEYENKLWRFKKSYDIFVKLYNGSMNNNTVSASELIKSNNTWYIIVDFNNAMSLKEYMETEEITLYDVAYALMKTAEVIHSLHTFCENSYNGKGEEDGYLHLDLAPSNILYIATDRCARILDTDSFIKKREIWDDEVDVTFSISEGYTSPEQKSCSRYRISEKSDIYSLGAIMYEYLVGKKAIAIGSSMNKEELAQLEQELDEGILGRYNDCSRKVRKQIREFIYKTIAIERSKRYDSMAEAAAVLSDISKQVDPQEVYIREDYRPNEKPVYGREKKIEEIEEKFAKQKSANRIVCISGMGGIGKSTLARAYAQKYRDYYDVITEVYSDNAEGALAGVNLMNYPQDIEVEIRMSKLSELVTKQKTLIIVNDYNTEVDKTFEKFRNMQCDIVLTNWNDMSDIVPTIQLGCEDLTSDEAVDIFMLHYKGNIGEGEEQVRVKEQIKKLVELVDNHPLGIELLAKHMSFREGDEITPEEMIYDLELYGMRDYEEKEFYNVKDGKENIKRGNIYHHLNVIFGRALDKGELSSHEVEILKYMTLVSPVYGISVKRLEEWTGMGKCVPDTLQSLKNKGWLEYHKDGIDLLYNSEGKNNGTYHMVMVVQETLCRRENMRSTIANSSMFLEKCKTLDNNSCRNMELLGQEIGQIKVVCNHFNFTELSEYVEMLILLGYLKGIFYNYRIEYVMPIFQQALDLVEKEPKKNDVLKARIYQNIGALYSFNKKYKLAIKYEEEALLLYERNPLQSIKRMSMMVTVVENLGQDYLETGYNEGAIKYLESGLSIREKIYNKIGYSDVSGLINSYINVASAYKELGIKSDIAKEYSEKALQLSLLNSHSAGLLRALGNKGIELCNKEQYARALSYLEKAVAISEVLYGEVRAETIEIYHATMKCNKACGNYDNAIKCAEQLIKLYEKNNSLEKLEIRVAHAYVIMAECLEIKGEKNIEAYLQKAIEILDRETVSQDKIKAGMLKDLGVLYIKIGSVKESMLCYEKALAIYNCLPEVDHYMISSARYGLAYTKFLSGKYGESIAEIADVIKYVQENLADENIVLADCYQLKGVAYAKKGNVLKARRCLEKAYELYVNAGKQDTENAVICKNNLNCIMREK